MDCHHFFMTDAILGTSDCLFLKPPTAWISLGDSHSFKKDSAEAIGSKADAEEATVDHPSSFFLGERRNFKRYLG